MSNYNLGLSFLDPKKKGDIGSPFAQIFVKASSRDAKGTLYISPQCVSLAELEEQCERLKKEIDNIRKKAQRQFGNR